MDRASRSGWRSWRGVAAPLLIGSALLAATPLRADDADAAGPDAYAACGDDDAPRLRYLEEHLDERARYARLWWWGWNGVFVGGMAVQGTRAGLEDERGERAYYIASAVQSTIGLTRNLWSPPHAKDGVEALTDLSLGDPAACRARRERAEALMERNAEEAHDERKDWKPHVFNLALNLAAGIVVAESYDYDAAYWHALLGFAVGEVRILSYPWQAEGDWEAYRARFPEDSTRAPRAPSWSLAPWHQGLRITFRY